MRSTALLLQDHRHIFRALSVLEGMATLAERGHNPSSRDVQDLLEFLDGFGDRIHQGREEGILFPALLRDPDQKNYPKLRTLTFDHNRQRSLIEGMQDSLLTLEKKGFAYYATRLIEILRRHLEDEEKTLFPLADCILSREDDERIVREMKAQDKAWHDKNVPRLLALLDNLESKYSTPKVVQKARGC